MVNYAAVCSESKDYTSNLFHRLIQ